MLVEKIYEGLSMGEYFCSDLWVTEKVELVEILIHFVETGSNFETSGFWHASKVDIPKVICVPTEHAHESEVELGVSKEGSGVINYGLGLPCCANVAYPQISMEEAWCNTAILKVGVHTRDDPLGEDFEGKVFVLLQVERGTAVWLILKRGIHLGLQPLGEEYRPTVAPRVVHGGERQKVVDGETKATFVYMVQCRACVDIGNDLAEAALDLRAASAERDEVEPLEEHKRAWPKVADARELSNVERPRGENGRGRRDERREADCLGHEDLGVFDAVEFCKDGAGVGGGGRRRRSRRRRRRLGRRRQSGGGFVYGVSSAAILCAAAVGATVVPVVDDNVVAHCFVAVPARVEQLEPRDAGAARGDGHGRVAHGVALAHPRHIPQWQAVWAHRPRRGLCCRHLHTLSCAASSV
jgi:hypothetical protein